MVFLPLLFLSFNVVHLKFEMSFSYCFFFVHQMKKLIAFHRFVCNPTSRFFESCNWGNREACTMGPIVNC